MNLFKNLISWISDFWGRNHRLLEKLYVYSVLLFVSYTLADLSTLYLRPYFLPKKTPRPLQKKREKRSSRSNTYYNFILVRNIFNPDGTIPSPLYSKKISKKDDSDSVTFSKLPLKLLGTLVHANPSRSVVSIYLKSSREIFSYRVGEKIKTLAEIMRIERKKVFFRNLNNGRMEYIEIPDELKVQWLAKKKSTSSSSSSQSDTLNFSVSRSVLNSYMDKLPSLLQQAKMIPVKGAEGDITGFKFGWIKKGSFFEKLGFKKNDILKQVNGEEISSPSEGLRLYNSLKNSENIALGIIRGGKEKTFEYTIK